MKYIPLLSRGGLKVPSDELSDYVSQGFAILDATSEIICNSSLAGRTADDNSDKRRGCAVIYMKKVFLNNSIVSSSMYFSTIKLISTDSVKLDAAKEFKKKKLNKQ